MNTKLIISFFTLLRWPNLLVIAFTQYLLHYRVIVAHSGAHLPDFELFLLVVSTVLIAASGNVVNDIADVEIDKVNKPIEKQIVDRVFSRQVCLRIYWLLVAIGFVISCYLAIFIDNFWQILIYPLTVLLLWLYSKSLKCSVIWGNLLVSFFCGFVAWIVWYAQSLYGQTSREMNEIFLGYALFAFVANLLRELIKDMEDLEGDFAQGCQTLPVKMGMEVSKKIALAVGLVFLGFLGLAHRFQVAYPLKIWALDLLVGLPLLGTMYGLQAAKTKKDFSRLSQISKWIMLAGVLALLF